MQPRSACRPRPRVPSPARRAEERGVVAMLTAIMLPLLVVVMLGVVDVGFLYLHRHELENASEAQALAYSLYMMSSPDNGALGDYPSARLPKMVPASSRWPGDGQAQQRLNWARTQQASYVNEYASPLNVPNSAPASVAQFQGTHPFMASSLIPAFGTKTLATYTSTIVPQFQWNYFWPVRHRIVLVLDYSETMQNTFTTNPGLRAIEALRSSVTKLLSDSDPGAAPYLAQRVNWGLVLFAGDVLDTPVDLVPLPADFSSAPVLTGGQSPYATNVDKILNAMKRPAGRASPTQPPGDLWSATQMVVGIQAALNMIKKHDDQASQFARQYLAGPATILIVSDGEPSFRAKGDYAQPTYDARVLFAQQVTRDFVRNSVWNYKDTTTLTITTSTTIAGSTQDQVDFMQSISGSRTSQGSAAATAVINGSPQSLESSLLSINPTTHCLAWPQMRMPQANPAQLWATPPLNIDASFVPGRQQGDHYFGFGIVNQEAASAREWQIGRARDPNAGFDPNPDGSPLRFPTAAANHRFYVYPSDVGQVNAGRNMVELNVSFCLPYIQNQVNNKGNLAPVFRARWGGPRALKQNRGTWPN